MFRRTSYNVTYKPADMNGEAGFTYEVRARGRLIRSGWSKGRKHLAEAQARNDVRELQQRAA